MLHIYNNSVITPIVANCPTSYQLSEYCKMKGITLYFKADFAVFYVIGVRTIKVPKKCLKSFENLFTWVRERVEKELSNIKYIKS